eukprot:CAMPEP_0117693476 /NCGR_PEP_ID=MMETSP0804-20121206/26897_1 /TAXON_ID=1074897 /ORGANISM="Tetraselmis astigmatica, Strain CCMP880" /LENGTH=374 /DNA_ID=CAMNT_0005507025 /DNA_START=305 /DNA_END=1427 /DNA_ORIENTATION=-
MDLKALQSTKNHYNFHANTHIDQEQARAAREQGVALPLKKFHNSIKRTLIRRFAYGADRLLDLACGRGGDLQKWLDAKVKFVKGIDLSPGEIEEAKRRYHELCQKKRRNPIQTFVEFEDTEQLGLGEWQEPEPFDAVTCMFAIHYFFVSEAALKNMLGNVARNLKNGGYFFGTCPDGKGILTLLNQTKQWISGVCTIYARWQGKYECFGSAYSMAIADTVTEGHEVAGVKGKGSFEYLVFRNVLEGVAAQFNLYPVKDYGDPEMASLFSENDKHQLFKHFNPSYPNSDPDLEKASAVNVAFCFQKLEGGPAVEITLPALPPADITVASNGLAVAMVSWAAGPPPGRDIDTTGSSPEQMSPFNKSRRNGGSEGVW